jgi:hypothetical protein
MTDGLKRLGVFALIFLPPDLCLHLLIRPHDSTQILLFVLVEAFIGGSAMIFSLLLIPPPKTRGSNASQVLDRDTANPKLVA